MGNCNSSEVHIVEEKVFEMIEHLFQIDFQLGMSYISHYISMNIPPAQQKKLISLIPTSIPPC